jgi:hypothetical protein
VVDVLSSFALWFVSVRCLQCGASPLSGSMDEMTSSNDSFSCASFYFPVFYLVCRILINSFRFSLFYTELPTKAKRPAYPLEWVWFEPSLYFFMERS